MPPLAPAPAPAPLVPPDPEAVIAPDIEPSSSLHALSASNGQQANHAQRLSVKGRLE
jgi:hypothetical protein